MRSDQVSLLIGNGLFFEESGSLRVRRPLLTSVLTCAGYVEVHIEQGPVLERKGVALGVVPTICGQTRLTVTVQGAQARVLMLVLLESDKCLCSYEGYNVTGRLLNIKDPGGVISPSLC